MTRFHGVVAWLLFRFRLSPFDQRSAIQKRIGDLGVVLQVLLSAFSGLKTKLGEAFYAVSLFVTRLLGYSSAERGSSSTISPG